MLWLGDLHRLPVLRATVDRSIDRAIACVWAAFAAGEITEQEAERIDAELRCRQRDIVQVFPRRGVRTYA
jgi:uncharacterized membrane protein